MKMIYKIKITKFCIALLLVLSNQLNSDGKQNPPNSTFSYQNRVNNVLLKMAKMDSVSDEEIVSILPKTEREYLIYYHCSYGNPKDSVNIGFNKFEPLLHRRGKRNKQVMFRHLQLAPFVDGEYADGFEGFVEGYELYQADWFCEVYPQLSNNAKKKLKVNYLNAVKNQRKIKNGSLKRKV